MSVAIAVQPRVEKSRDMTPQDFQEAMPQLLDGMFCSSRWMLDCFDAVAKESGEVVFRLVPGRYPPGGKATKMIPCPSCGNLVPRDVIADQWCLDCQDAHFIARVDKYENDPVTAEMKNDLSARWWRTRPPSEDAITRPQALLDSHSAFSLASDVADAVSDQQADDLACAGNEPVTSDERPMGKGFMSHAKALEHLTRLFNPKPGSTRAPCTKIFLLDESDESLRMEIEYWRQTGEIIPSALRIDNPYKPDKPVHRRKSRRKRHSASRRT